MTFAIEQPSPKSQSHSSYIVSILWPSALLLGLLSILSSQPVIWSAPNWGVGGSLFHVRSTELLVIIAAILASLGTKRIQVMAGNFLFASLPTLIILHWTDLHRDFQFDAYSIPTAAIKWLAQCISFCCNIGAFYFFGVAPDPDRNVIDSYYGAMAFISCWWIGAIVACAQDLCSAVWKREDARSMPRLPHGRWNVSLKTFLILVSLAAWTFGVLQMPLWRQRYAAVAMLVMGALIAAFCSGSLSEAVQRAGRGWLLVAGIHLGFLMLVRGDVAHTLDVDSAASTAVMEIAMVPLLDEEKPWDWWKDFDGIDIDALWDVRARGYIITWSSLLCLWVATNTAFLCYRRTAKESDAANGQRQWELSRNSTSRIRRIGPACGGFLLLGGLTSIASLLTVEQAAHFAMKLTEAAFLVLVVTAFAAQGRIRRFAVRFLTVALAFLFIEQFATFYRLEQAWGDSPFLRLYTWLWNWRRGEPYPPYEHERHLLLNALTRLHVDYLVACDCITSWWLGAFAAFTWDVLDPGSLSTEPQTVDSSAPCFWTPWRRMLLLAVTMVSIATAIWLCQHPDSRYYSLSLLEGATILAGLAIGIPVGAYSVCARRWLIALAVCLALVFVAFSHERKWGYWDFGLIASFFDLLYLHLFEGKSLAFWRIVPPDDSLLVDRAAKEFSMSLLGVFAVWFASVAAICWRAPLPDAGGAEISAN